MTEIITPFSSDEAKLAIKDRVLAASLKKIESKFGALEGVTADKAEDVEKAIFKAISDDDRWGYYQIHLVEAKSTKELSFGKSNFSHKFIGSPQKESWYNFVLDANTVAFGRYTTYERRVEREETLADGSNRTISVTEAKNTFLSAEVELVKTKKRTAILIKYPWYRKRISQGYTFQKEGLEIITWVTQNLQIAVEPFPLKEFFDGFQSLNSYDKSEFRLSGLMSETGPQNSVAMRLASPERGLTDAYKNLDRVLASSLNNSMLEKFIDFVERSSIEDKKMVIEAANSFFDARPISSQEIFEILTQTFEYGLGTISYSKGKELYQYKMDYSEDVTGLIRASRLGGSVFERIWSEIIKYIDR